jgi:hypothetical protein
MQPNIKPDPEALELLLAKKAEEFEDADIDLLIAHFRAERERFQLREAAGKRATRSAKPVDATAAKLIEDLGL